MFLKIKSKINKKLLFFTFIAVIASIILRVLSLKNYGFLSNDDIAYFKLAENLFSGKGFVYDLKEIVPEMKNTQEGFHVHFPPGYPVIIGISSFFFDNLKQIRDYEWIFLSTINCLLITITGWKVTKKRKYLTLILSFLIPVLTYGVGTITIGSENWFLTTSLLGIIACLSYSRNNKYQLLFIANIMFAISYLIRPEGILFFTSTIFASLINIKKIFTFDYSKKQYIKSEILGLILCFLIPIFIFILPYIVFLYREIGIITLTGKSLNWNELNAIKNTGIFSSLLNKSLALIDVVFLSPYFLGISFSLFVFIIFSSAIISYKEIKISELNRKLKDIFILGSPLPFCIYSYLKYDPYSRSIFCFIPSIFVITLIFSEVFNKLFDYQMILKIKKNQLLTLSPVFIILSFTCVLNIFLPFFSNNFMADSPNLYYKAVEKISLEDSNKSKGIKTIWSRDLSSSLLGKNYNFCNNKEVIAGRFLGYSPITVLNKNCQQDIDYFILSNIVHDSMPQPTKWEIDNLNNEKVTINEQTYKKLFQLANIKNNRNITGFKRSNVSGND